MRLGVAATTKIYFLKTLPTEKRATDARIRLNGVPEGFWIRPKGSDLDVVLQIFSARDYDLSWCMPYKVYIKELCDQILHDGNVPLIIDAGANLTASAPHSQRRPSSRQRNTSRVLEPMYSAMAMA